ncbi:MAG: hypothetical protein LBS96_03490 [Oscillospiraceae bacterium]|jgi:hypothetical protein|nr:hypothetical protein [Oscillospiraceae bacterium]
MALLNRKKQPKAVEQPAAPAAPARRLPELERSFFTLLLQELYGGLQDLEQLAKRPEPKNGREELLHKSGRIRATAAYALALLHLDDCRTAPEQPEALDLLALLNIAVNALRRDFLFAGVSVRRPPSIAPVEVHVPKETFLFLLEEMLGCCLRCAPNGKHLHITLKETPHALLLSMRTEGAAVQHPPLLPLPPTQAQAQAEEQTGQSAPAPEEDYGFAVSRVLAERLHCRLRWEADEAGVRLFLEMPEARHKAS